MTNRILPAVVAAALATSALARADDAPVGTRQVTDDMHSYYGGERASAYVVATLGTLAVAGGIVLVTRDTDFARGFGVPLIALGALEGIGAVIYAFQVGAEIRHYQASIDRSGAAFREEELAHMRGTRSRFVWYLAAEIGLSVIGAGIATYGFASDQDTWKGIGLGVASIALPFVLIDSINNARAGAYARHVRLFNPSLAFAPGGFRIGLNGTF
ncbi:MAG TPA: hypothetical protein VGH28_10950 [Polyangiaceae bacterium]|jgi:hypothetical protein